MLIRLDRRIKFIGIEDDKFTVECSDLEDKKFVEDLFGEFTSMGWSDDKDQPFLFTKKILDEYFRGKIKSEIVSTFLSVGIRCDKDVSVSIRSNKAYICNRLCGIISNLYDVK